MVSFVIELFSRKVPINTSDSEEHITALVDYIQGKREAVDPDQKLPEMTAAILTLLNLADDFFKEREKIKKFKEDLDLKTNHLLGKVSGSGGGPSIH